MERINTVARVSHLVDGVVREAVTPRTIVSVSALPSEYIELEYIESTGTQYLDTGYNDPNGFRIITRFMQTQNPGKWAAVMGTENGDGQGVDDRNSVLSYVENGINRCRFNLGSNNIYYVDEDNELGVWYDLDASSIKTDRHVIRDGVNLALTEVSVTKTYLSTLSLYLFALHTINGVGLLNMCRLGPTRFYNSNSELIDNFIPAQRRSDGVRGMYDAAKNVFIKNLGGGDDFIAGPEVPASQVTTYHSRRTIVNI